MERLLRLLPLLALLAGGVFDWRQFGEAASKAGIEGDGQASKAGIEGDGLASKAGIEGDG